jgi:adenine/guanine phosphoribosyltransferase-like PRPP-binding protein
MEHKHVTRCAQHLTPFMDPKTQKLVVRKCIALLKTKEFDTIAFRGLSGALIAPIVAMRMGKSLMAVRKGEQCHSHHQVEGNAATKRYVIIDDFISLGCTVHAILNEVLVFAPEAKCIGVVQAYYLAPDTDIDRNDYGTVFVTSIVKQWMEEKKQS